MQKSTGALIYPAKQTLPERALRAYYGNWVFNPDGDMNE